jgi:hypothetical protein
MTVAPASVLTTLGKRRTSFGVQRYSSGKSTNGKCIEELTD